MPCKLRAIGVALEIPGPLNILFVVVSWWAPFDPFVVTIIPSVGFLISVLGPTNTIRVGHCCLTLKFRTYPSVVLFVVYW